jgi:YbgC/YbaW family acyl-CoA thioester hydrolase
MSFTATYRVQFSDTDMAGIMHFANYLRYMESTEHAFFRSLGLSVHMEIGGVTVGWPRVHAECSYRAPLRFEEEFEVRHSLVERSRRRLKHRFVFVRCSDGVEVAAGSFTTVCVGIQPDGGLSGMDIPEPIASRLPRPIEGETHKAPAS